MKIYALENDGVENASCEFDVSTLKPTYRLMIGVPGKSNAFAISSRLGVPDDVVEAARSFVSDDEMKLDKITEALESARQEAEREKSEAEKLKLELEKSYRKAKTALQEAEDKKEKIVEKDDEE